MHEAVAEALLFGTHYVHSSQFEDFFNFMSESQTDDSTVTNMEIQYEVNFHFFCLFLLHLFRDKRLCPENVLSAFRHHLVKTF
jgi:hypothetical protein